MRKAAIIESCGLCAYVILLFRYVRLRYVKLLYFVLRYADTQGVTAYIRGMENSGTLSYELLIKAIRNSNIISLDYRVPHEIQSRVIVLNGYILMNFGRIYQYVTSAGT